MKIMPLKNYPHVVPSQYDLRSYSEQIIRYFRFT